jgi:hypothetical protein
MTHLNNGIDTVARFFEGDDTLIALFDHPDEVKRLINENHELFMRYADEFCSDMQPLLPAGRACTPGIKPMKPGVSANVWGFLSTYKEGHFGIHQY